MEIFNRHYLNISYDQNNNRIINSCKLSPDYLIDNITKDFVHLLILLLLGYFLLYLRFWFIKRKAQTKTPSN